MKMPERWLRAVRTDADGTERTLYVFFVASAEPDARGNLDVKCHGPEALLLTRPLRFEPPLAAHGSALSAFEFYWKLLDYVFGLPDPASFPRLTGQLITEDQKLVDRYISRPATLPVAE